MNEPYIQALRDAIRQMHACLPRYVQTVAVKEESKGKIVWEGEVGVFDLAGHATARQCYAWRYKDDDGRWQYVAMLRTPAVDSPRGAVGAYVASQQKV
jgi:hypothetical protein